MTRSRITYSSFHSPTSGAGIPKGAIAGIVVGIFLGAIVFPLLGFILWRHRRQRNFIFIQPSVHKARDITEVLDIRPGPLGQRRKPSTRSSISELSLDLFPVTIPQVTSSRSRASPPTFPRSPTTSSPSPAKRSPDDGGRDVHSPGAIDQNLGMHVRDPRMIDSENAPSPGFNRRSSVRKPSGPRPQSHRTSTGDPWTSTFIPLAQIMAEPGPAQNEQPSEPPEPKIQQVNAEGETATYSFLDMAPISGPPSIMEGPGKSQSSIRSLPPINVDSLHHPPVARISSVPSHRDPDRRRESGNSRQLSLSAVIRQLPPLKLRQSTEFHPYSPHPPGHPQRPRSYRPSTGGASPTESVPATASEVSEIRFCSPNESPGSNASPQRSGLDPHSPSLKATAIISPIYQKLFGTHQGEAPPDGLLANKRPLRRKQPSPSTFNTPPRT